MSTAAISVNPTPQPLQAYFQQRTSDLSQLGTALQSGNLAGAQQAFSTLQTLAQASPLPNSNAFAVSQREQDFNAIGQALQSGDLTGAQQAFAQLQSTFHNQQRVLDPIGPPVVINLTAPPAAASSTSSSSPSTASGQSSSPVSSTTAAAPELVINLGNSGGPEQITIGLNNTSAGEQLTISVAGQQGTSPEQLTLNLGANSQQQIILNLLNSTSTNSSQSSAVNVQA